MELRLLGRGALAGLLAGIVAWVFSLIFVEPLIDKAIEYEEGRSGILDAITEATGGPVGPEEPEVLGRGLQSTAGLATGIVGMAVAMGLLVAVAYLALHGRFRVRPRVVAFTVGAIGFLGVFLLPFVKYPANPPAIGHDFTIGARSGLYLLMVAVSLVLLVAAVYAARHLASRLGWTRAVVLSFVGFLVIYGIVIGVLPSLGNLSANTDVAGEFGYAAAATETPQPIVNVLDTALVLDGVSYAPGQLIFPGFDADLLWSFRWYSIVNQLIIWGGTALVFGGLVDRFVTRRSGAGRQSRDDDAAVTTA